MPQIISRSDAIKNGLKRYFTGKPCRHGHVSERQVSTHRCVTCNLNVSLQWAKENRCKRNAWARNSYTKEKDAVRPSRTKEFFSAKQAKRRSKIYNSAGTHTKDDILKILAMQNGKCINCNVIIYRGFHVDHIHPISKGGSNSKENLQCLCAACNRSKYNKLPEVWARENGRLL